MKRANIKSDSMEEKASTASSSTSTSKISTENYEQEDQNSLLPSLLERFIVKMQALIWVTLAIFVFLYTDLLPILLSDSRIERFYLNVAIVCFTINVICLLYAIFFLPCIQGVKIPWDVYVPRLVPITALLGIISGLAFIRSLWGVFGFLSPIIVFFETFGLFFSLHFVPALPFLDD